MPLLNNKNMLQFGVVYKIKILFMSDDIIHIGGLTVACCNRATVNMTMAVRGRKNKNMRQLGVAHEI